MKNLPATLGRLAVVLSATLTLGACSRANYAVLPRADAYLNSATAVAKPRPAAPAAEAAPAQAPAAAPAAPASVGVAEAPAAPAAAAVAAPAAAAAPAPAAAPAATVATAPAPKLNLVQRLALKKIGKKLDKLTANLAPAKRHEAAAAGGGLDANLRYALIFGIVGLILTLFDIRILTILGIVGIVIGLVFLLLWVLDKA